MLESTDRPEMKDRAVQMRWGVKVPLRDGIHLSATLYLPESHSAPSPVVFTLTPYIAQAYHERGRYFATHGIPFLAVDVRGRGNSEGEFTLADDGQDGYDVVEWLATQPYCNGKVAMWGGSYMGHVQWATAKELPPHLATIVPVASPYRGVDSPMRNNIFSSSRIQWLTLLWGRVSQDKIFADQALWNRQFLRWFVAGLPFKELDVCLGNGSAIFQEWLAHPEQGAYWDRYNPMPQQYAEISIPVLTITGIYDGDQPGALMHYREHLANHPEANHYLIIGPWDHAGTRTPKQSFCGLTVGQAAMIDLPKLHQEWYAWTMLDGPKPEFLQNRVAYYVTGAERWRYADGLEQLTTSRQQLYLQSTKNPTDVFSAGTLAATSSTNSNPDCYTYDPCDVSLAELESTVDPESRVDHRMVYASAGRLLIYHSEPFQGDTEVSGFFKLSVWLAINRPDTDFHVAIYESCIDGSAIQLTSDVMRARYRESLRQPNLIRTTAPLRYDFERFMFVSRLVKRGSRLRLVIGPINSIFSQKNYNSGGVVAEESMRDAKSVTVQLFHDEAHPSVLHVPFGAA